MSRGGKSRQPPPPESEAEDRPRVPRPTAFTQAAMVEMPWSGVCAEGRASVGELSVYVDRVVRFCGDSNGRAHCTQLEFWQIFIYYFCSFYSKQVTWVFPKDFHKKHNAFETNTARRLEKIVLNQKNDKIMHRRAPQHAVVSVGATVLAPFENSCLDFFWTAKALVVFKALKLRVCVFFFAVVYLECIWTHSGFIFFCFNIVLFIIRLDILSS